MSIKNVTNAFWLERAVAMGLSGVFAYNIVDIP